MRSAKSLGLAVISAAQRGRSMLLIIQDNQLGVISLVFMERMNIQVWLAVAARGGATMRVVILIVTSIAKARLLFFSLGHLTLLAYPWHKKPPQIQFAPTQKSDIVHVVSFVCIHFGFASSHFFFRPRYSTCPTASLRSRNALPFPVYRTHLLHTSAANFCRFF